MLGNFQYQWFLFAYAIKHLIKNQKPTKKVLKVRPILHKNKKKRAGCVCLLVVLFSFSDGRWFMDSKPCLPLASTGGLMQFNCLIRISSQVCGDLNKLCSIKFFLFFSFFSSTFIRSNMKYSRTFVRIWMLNLTIYFEG